MKELRDYQKCAIEHMHNGCILCGGVGTGKSFTSLEYYKQKIRHMDIYIITTARKRDTNEWFDECLDDEVEPAAIDSWNNIHKYEEVENAFFIFDEQRVVGSGSWVKSFLKICKKNQWILLSATPGDTWTDYIPVFIANGYYKNRTEFVRQHVVYSRFTKFPMVTRYLEEAKLIRLRSEILVKMSCERKTEQHHEDVVCTYDKSLYRFTQSSRVNPWTDVPIETPSELCGILRRVAGTTGDRYEQLIDILRVHPKAIIFYNFDYELSILRGLVNDVAGIGGCTVAEWNGHKHEAVPESERWVYLVQYAAGAEGWNCVATDTLIFWSQNYSYKMMEQAAGRIDRMNTPFVDLYYYHFKTTAPIDIAITSALRKKKNFNEKEFIGRYGNL